MSAVTGGSEVRLDVGRGAACCQERCNIVTWMWIAFAVFVLVPGLAMVWNRAQVRREYRRTVGLELTELTSLLPADLRDREYTRFIPRISPDGDHMFVGLIYVTSERRIGNPPNVGLEFDRRGNLIAVHPEGVGLGIK